MSTNFENGPQHLSPVAAAGCPRPLSRSTPERQGQHSRRTSGSLSPHMSKASPLRQSSAPRSTDRSLPSRNVTAESLTDAYVAFILYCNPQISVDVDTTTLRAGFISPPKSDNKDFEVYRLYELIKQFDAKEIKTWGQLVIDLGVEPPDVSKGQSVQKVQQYSVRLKRWMRAMHIDAFFEYLLDKQHSYYTELPHPSDPYPSGGRDGVAAEEDLAIRALDPSFRPKRGRRRNSDIEAEDNALALRRQGSMEPGSAVPRSAHPGSAMPTSAHPNGAMGAPDPWAVASAVTPHNFAPWARNVDGSQSAVNTSAPSQLRWQIHGPSQESTTPYPSSAHPTSMISHIDSAFDQEPRSAITPSARKRRKHGPAVSSAWNSTSAAGAKPRGRPPASRNMQDGPFTTFPADPSNDKSNNTTYQAPPAQMDMSCATQDQPAETMARPPLTARHSDGAARPGRLSLQVPAHTGGPVRLATPPRVLLNGESDDSERVLTQSPVSETAPWQLVGHAEPNSSRRPLTFGDKDLQGFAFEILKRALASDLLRAELRGRDHRISGEEAKRLADTVLERLNVPRVDGATTRDDIARMTAASWLGLGGHLNVPLGPSTGQNKRIAVTRFRVDADGYEEIVSAREPPSNDIRDVFDLSWNVSMGGCTGLFELNGLSLSNAPQKSAEDSHDALLREFAEMAKRLGVEQPRIDKAQRIAAAGAAEEGVDWKKKYMMMEFSARIAKGELDRVRDRMIEKVLDACM